jgi:ABC-type amino acid transport substrate-binding protein
MKKDGLQENLSESKKNHMIAQAGGLKLNRTANNSIFLVVMFFLTFQQTVAAESRRVKVGSDDHFPVIFQDKDGVAQGLYVDLLSEIGRKENIRFEYVFGTWDNALNLIKSGKIDLLPGIAFSEERSQYMDYCKIPLLTVWGELYALQSSDIKSILDISGKKIGVIKNDINAKNFLELTKNFHIKCEFVELAGYEDVFKAVKTETVDAGVVGISFGATKQGEYGLRSTGVVFNPYDLYISTTKGKNQDLILILDKYLSEWRNQDISVLSNAKQKWIYGSVGTVAVAPDWMINVFVLLAIMIAVALTFIMILKLQVQRATKTLRESESKQARMIANIGEVIVIID